MNDAIEYTQIVEDLSDLLDHVLDRTDEFYGMPYYTTLFMWSPKELTPYIRENSSTYTLALNLSSDIEFFMDGIGNLCNGVADAV